LELKNVIEKADWLDKKSKEDQSKLFQQAAEIAKLKGEVDRGKVKMKELEESAKSNKMKSLKSTLKSKLGAMRLEPKETKMDGQIEQMETEL